MTDSASVLDVASFEFRCTNCYQPLRTLVDDAGKKLTCPWCETETVAPEATAERIERALAAGEDVVVDEPSLSFALEEPPTRAELRQMASERAERRSRDNVCKNPAWMSASRVRRLLAILVDSCLIGVASVLGTFTDIFLVRCGIFDTRTPTWSLAKLLPNDNNPVLTYVLSRIYVPLHTLLIFSAFIAAMLILQWFLIATRGQSLGKKLLKIKIVDGQGQPPGFFCGVIVRNFSRGALVAIQLFGGSQIVGTLASCLGLADVLFIFREPPRCLHDHLAGTYVIDA